MPDAIAAKMCSVCGVDCSTMKRAKDASGRYICGECLERAREAKVAAQGKPIVVATGPIVPKAVASPLTKDGVDPILDDLVSKSAATSAKPCTECGFPMRGDAVLCTHCGFNTTTGKGTRIAVHRAPKETGGDGLPKRKRANPLVFYSMSIGGGVLAGALMAFVWAKVIESTGYEIRLLAVLVGAVVGFGTYAGAQGFSNSITGLFAAAVALMAIVFGRYFGVMAIAGQLGIETNATFFDILPRLIFDPWFGLWSICGGVAAFRVGSEGLSR